MCILVICAMLVITLAVKVFPVYIQKQQIDTFAVELIREQKSQAVVLKPPAESRCYLKTGLYPTVTWSKTGKIQLNEEVRVTLSIRQYRIIFRLWFVSHYPAFRCGRKIRSLLEVGGEMEKIKRIIKIKEHIISPYHSHHPISDFNFVVFRNISV